jgi:hypothetical protein
MGIRSCIACVATAAVLVACGEQQDSDPVTGPSLQVIGKLSRTRAVDTVAGSTLAQGIGSKRAAPGALRGRPFFTFDSRYRRYDGARSIPQPEEFGHAQP